MQEAPWKRLQPSSDSNHSTALRVDETHPWDLFWAVGQDGSPQLACRLRADTELPAQEEVPRIKAIKVSFARVGDWCWCVIELQDKSFEDIFLSLCLALVEATRGIQSEAGVTSVLLRHLARWQRMLGRAPLLHTLSLEDQIGLAGELVFMRDYLLSALPVRDAVSCWVAPQGHPQDFMAPGGKAVEVKCRQATSPDLVHISSQWQLAQESLQLYLVVFTLTHSDRGSGFSLHALVQSLRKRLELEPTILDELEEALLQRGYVDNPEEYDRRWWSLSATRSYLVEGEFPRLGPSGLPQGIVGVSYTLSLPACETWTVAVDRIFE